MASASQPETKVEEDLSRMEGAYGKELIGKLKKMDVFISGLQGLGIETAKNLILAGPHSVVVHDDGKVNIEDLGANFYLHSSHVGKPRGESVLEQLANLNPNVTVKLHKGAVTPDALKDFHVVVFTGHNLLKEMVAIDKFCHQNNIKFIWGQIDGVVASIFTDFGPQHKVFDQDGVLEKTIIIDSITNDKHGIVTIDGDRHLLSDGDIVRLEEVEGMTKEKINNPDHVYKHSDVIVDINACHEIKTVKKRPNQFSIGDTSQLGKYTHGGIGTQLKVQRVFTFRTLEDNLVNPQFCDGYVDFTKFGTNVQLHFARLALCSFQEAKGHLPGLHSEDDAKAVIELAKKHLSKHKEIVEGKGQAVLADAIDEKIVRNVSLYSQAELSPFAALFGGVLAQEIVKFTGKYTPISQWLHFDTFEMLGDTVPADAKRVGSRYDHQISIFGKAFQEKLESQKIFLVGCGALGCEYLKAIAMTGMGAGAEKGQVYITDMDRIELSNLNRQFLFRRRHVGHPKSLSAAEAAKEMNPGLSKTLKVFEIRVEPNTENIFNDSFWDGLDFVVNALDNNIARRYTDSKCVVHLKPLFESGTLGTQANTVIVLPHQTPSYSEGAVAGEGQGIAQCTLQNFPSLPLHCIEWAREMFGENFVDGPQKYMDFVEDPENFLKKNAQEKLEELNGLLAVKKWYQLAQEATFETCVKLAFDEFVKRYRNIILDLTHSFPRDARIINPETKADLGPFWHGHKRFPQAVEFDSKNEEHLDYIFHGANIFANVFRLQEEKSREVVRAIASKFKAAAWTPTKVVIKEDNDNKEEKSEAVVSDEAVKQINEIKTFLRSLDRSKLKKLLPMEFEKDDDKNHHIDWITASTNMRANNYFIKPSTRANVRLTAGRIIPAIATTTACITGFVQLEIFKHVLQRPLVAHRFATIDLAVNTFVLENLPDPIKVKADKKEEESVFPTTGFTVWDKVLVDKGNLTIDEFVTEFPKIHFGVKINSLFKQGLTEVDVKEGKGQALYLSRNPFAGAYKMAKQMLLREDLGEQHRARFQKQVDDHDAWAAKYAVGSKKLIQHYTDTYGPLVTSDRNYVLLDGVFEDAEGNHARIPTIKYIFKADGKEEKGNDVDVTVKICSSKKRNRADVVEVERNQITKRHHHSADLNHHFLPSNAPQSSN